MTSGSSNLITSGGVYEAIEEASKRTHIVIASYDTLNPLKANADYTCTSTNASDVLTEALSEIAAGGRIELLDGTYNMQWNEAVQGNDEVYSVDINLANVTIEGSGWGTTIVQCQDDDETMAAFRISAKNVTIKNLRMSSVSVGSPYPLVIQTDEAAVYENIFFIDNEAWTTYFSGESSILKNYGLIAGFGSCPYTRILNCRVFRQSGFDYVYMFNFANCDDFSGVIGGNISSCSSSISVLFASEDHQSETVLYGHNAITSDVYE